MAARALSILLALLVSFILFPVRGGAHHHIGCPNDTSSVETVTGRISQVDWSYPHVHIRLETGGSPVDPAQWIVETQNPGALVRHGVSSTALRIGDTLTVVLWRARDKSRQGFTKSMTLSDGSTVAFPIAELGCPF
jgi:hypothetical protein